MKGKAITAALIGAAVALGDTVREGMTPARAKHGQGHRSGGTRMSRTRGIRLNAYALKHLPATQDKINRRRSDPLHDKHHRFCSLADPCTTRHSETERVERHQVAA